MANDQRSREAGLNYMGFRAYPSVIGSLHGLFNDDEPTSGGMAFVPGVAASRFIRQRRALSRRLGNGEYNKTVSEAFGPAAQLALATLAGAGIGALTGNGWGGVGIGGAIGAGAGLLANEIGGIAAAATTTRDQAAQRKYEKSKGATLANWLIPGVGAYNGYKTIGHMLNSEDYYK